MLRRILLLPAAALALVPVALSGPSAPGWSDNISGLQHVRVGSAVIAVYRESCKGGGQRVAVSRVVSGKLSAPVGLSKCGEFALISVPSTAVAGSSEVTVAWTARSKSGKVRTALYAAVSRNAGKTFSKARVLRSVAGTNLPPTASIATYAKALFAIWGDFNLDFGQKRPNAFHLQHFDLRFGKAYPEMAGLKSYRVFPSRDALRIYAGRDGVVAFWQGLRALNKSDWYVADSQRINPYDLSKAIKMTYRGKAGDADVNSIQLGENGKIYRFDTASVGTGLKTTVTVTASVWKFQTHRFQTLGPVFQRTYSGTVYGSPVLAVTVGKDGRFYVAYRKESKANCMGSGIYDCTIAAAGQSFESNYEVSATKAGQPEAAAAADLSLPTPAAGATAEAVALDRGDANLLVTAGGVRLVTRYLVGEVDPSSMNSFFKKVSNVKTGYYQTAAVQLP